MLSFSVYLRRWRQVFSFHGQAASEAVVSVGEDLYRVELSHGKCRFVSSVPTDICESSGIVLGLC